MNDSFSSPRGQPEDSALPETSEVPPRSETAGEGRVDRHARERTRGIWKKLRAMDESLDTVEAEIMLDEPFALNAGEGGEAAASEPGRLQLYPGDVREASFTAYSRYREAVRERSSAQGGPLTREERKEEFIRVFQRTQREVGRGVMANITGAFESSLPPDAAGGEGKERQQVLRSIERHFSPTIEDSETGTSNLEQRYREIIAIESEPDEAVRKKRREAYINSLARTLGVTPLQAEVMYQKLADSPEVYRSFTQLRLDTEVASYDVDLAEDIVEARQRGDEEKVDLLIASIEDEDLRERVMGLRAEECVAYSVEARLMGQNVQRNAREVAERVVNEEVRAFIAAQLPLFITGGRRRGMVFSIVPISFDVERTGVALVNGREVSTEEPAVFFGEILKIFFDLTGADAFALMNARQLYVLIRNLNVGRSLSEVSMRRMSADLINLSSALGVRGAEPQSALTNLQQNLCLLEGSDDVHERHAEYLGRQYQRASYNYALFTQEQIAALMREAGE